MATFSINPQPPEVLVAIENDIASGRVNVKLAGHLIAYFTPDGKLNAIEYNVTSTPKTELEALGVLFVQNVNTKYVIDTTLFA